MYAVVRNSGVLEGEDSPFSILNTRDHAQCFIRGGLEGIRKGKVLIEGVTEPQAVGDLCGLFNVQSDAITHLRACEKKERTAEMQLKRKQEAEANAIAEKQAQERLALQMKQ